MPGRTACRSHQPESGRRIHAGISPVINGNAASSKRTGRFQKTFFRKDSVPYLEKISGKTGGEALSCFSTKTIHVRRTEIRLDPDQNRVVLRLLRFATKQEHAGIIQRALALKEKDAQSVA